MTRDEHLSRSIRRKIKKFAQEDSIVQKWEDSTYGEIQKITNPKKGLFGESLVAEWLDDLDYLSEGHGYNRTTGGDNYDILVLIDDRLEKVEVKLATQDSQNKYQFNWIKMEHNVSFIVLLGIDPSEIYMSVKTHKEIMDYVKNPIRGRKLTPVPPTGMTHVKWTASKDSADMVEIKTLNDVDALFIDAIRRWKS